MAMFSFAEQLNPISYSTKCDVVEEIVFLPERGYARPASQSPDITEQKIDDDDDDESWSKSVPTKFIEQTPSKFLKTPVPSSSMQNKLSPLVFLRAPAVNGDTSSTSEILHNSNQTPTENDILNVSAQNTFDPYLSSFVKNDVQTLKNVRDTKAARLLSAPIGKSSTAADLENGENISHPASNQRRAEQISSLYRYRNDPQRTLFPVGVSMLQYDFEDPIMYTNPLPPPPAIVTAPTIANQPNYANFKLTLPSYVNQRPKFSSTSFVSSNKPLSSDRTSIAAVDDSSMRHYSNIHSKLMLPSKTTKYIDTHCHLDVMFKKYKFDADYISFKKKYKSTWSPLYSSCITDFCRPATFSGDSRFFDEILENDDVYAAIGCHPFEVDSYDGDIESIILAKAIHPKVLAVGELGLDYSFENNAKEVREAQKIILERQLMLSVREINKPILLHCRKAEDDCLAIMKRLVPHDFPIHWHNFSGNLAMAEKWSFFTNMYFGLTTSIYDTASVVDTKVFCEKFRLDRILFETGAPKCLPAHYKRREFGSLPYNHPGLGALVGLKLAEIRKLSDEFVFDQIYQNTLRIYTGLSS